MSDPLYLKELMHNVAQALLYPTQIILISLVVFAIGLIACVVVEAVVERRHFKACLPQLVATVDASAYAELPQVVEASGLLRRQRVALQTLIAYGYLPEEARVALAKRLLSEQELCYSKVTSRTDLIAKVSPMIGLMGTLIPLGPGVVAMGQGQVDLLSASIEIAFDTTIAGLVVAAVALCVSRLRKRWYEDYLVALETVMSTVLEKARTCAGRGEDLGNAESAAAIVAALKAKRGKRERQGAVPLPSES